MSTNIESLAAAGRANGALRNHPDTLGQVLAAGALRLWQAYWDNRARRATVLMLEALDDRTLKDIGLSRSKIRPAVFDNDAARPRPYDPRWHRPAE